MTGQTGEDVILDNNFEDGDRFYADLIRRIDDLEGDEAALRYLARLALILANHIGDDRVLRTALDKAALNTTPHTASGKRS
jgi:hypothetical protein